MVSLFIYLLINYYYYYYFCLKRIGGTCVSSFNAEIIFFLLFVVNKFVKFMMCLFFVKSIYEEYFVAWLLFHCIFCRCIFFAMYYIYSVFVL
eukprot:gene5246-3757_t